MVESSGATTPGRCHSQENIESPAYSRGGHESAGFYGYGIQQVTRLMRVLLTMASGIIRTPGNEIKRSGAKFPRLLCAARSSHSRHPAPA